MLYKTTVAIWSDYNPGRLELSELAREAEVGAAYCSRMETSAVEDPATDPDWDGTEFFQGEEVTTDED